MVQDLVHARSLEVVLLVILAVVVAVERERILRPKLLATNSGLYLGVPTMVYMGEGAG